MKQRTSELTYKNNRYHLAISNCTFCAIDDAESPDASSVFDESIRASHCRVQSLPGSVVKEKQANTVEKSKAVTFIKRMVKTLAKLEAKYQIPEHKRKKQLFTKKRKPSSIVPKEFTSIFHDLAARRRRG